jgi:hypothetical protein
MQKLEHKFLFKVLILALVASLFQPAFAFNPHDVSAESYCDISQANPGSMRHLKHERCIGANAFHCATAPGCSLSANAFSMLPGQTDFELFRPASKASHTSRNPTLYTIYPNLPLRPPITRFL